MAAEDCKRSVATQEHHCILKFAKLLTHNSNHQNEFSVLFGSSSAPQSSTALKQMFIFSNSCINNLCLA